MIKTGQLMGSLLPLCECSLAASACRGMSAQSHLALPACMSDTSQAKCRRSLQPQRLSRGGLVGERCEAQHSTCAGRNELCIGRGPAYAADDFGFRSNEIIARRQAEAAARLWLDGGAPLLNISGATLSVAGDDQSNGVQQV